jgi:hypothetical protein
VPLGYDVDLPVDHFAGPDKPPTHAVIGLGGSILDLRRDEIVSLRWTS